MGQPMCPRSGRTLSSSWRLEVTTSDYKYLLFFLRWVIYRKVADFLTSLRAVIRQAAQSMCSNPRSSTFTSLVAIGHLTGRLSYSNRDSFLLNLPSTNTALPSYRPLTRSAGAPRANDHVGRSLHLFTTSIRDLASNTVQASRTVPEELRTIIADFTSIRRHASSDNQFRMDTIGILNVEIIEIPRLIFYKVDAGSDVSEHASLYLSRSIFGFVLTTLRTVALCKVGVR